MTALTLNRATVAYVLCALVLLQGAHAQDKEFWKQIVRNDYRVPAGQSAASLIEDLTDNLGSPDPELRDDLAYDISAAWIYKNELLSSDDLRRLIQKCERNLGVGIGEVGKDSVLLRSFSALELSLIAAFDNKKPFMSEAESQQLLTAALAYMNRERDLRGYDRDKGWIHATAHTADLLKFLGRSSRLKAADQARILDAIAGKLRQGGQVFVFGENERMAAATMSLVRPGKCIVEEPAARRRRIRFSPECKRPAAKPVGPAGVARSAPRDSRLCKAQRARQSETTPLKPRAKMERGRLVHARRGDQ
jgi:hypothetical protein